MDSPTQKKRAIAELKVSKFTEMIRKINNNPTLPVLLRVKGDNYELEWPMKPNWIGHVNVADLCLFNGEIIWPITNLVVPDKKYCCPATGPPKGKFHPTPFSSVLRKISSEHGEYAYKSIDLLFGSPEEILKCASLKIMSEYSDTGCRQMAPDVESNEKQMKYLQEKTDVQHDVYSVSSVGNIAYLALNAEPKKHRAVWSDFLKRYAKHRGVELKFEI